MATSSAERLRGAKACDAKEIEVERTVYEVYPLLSPDRKGVWRRPRKRTGDGEQTRTPLSHKKELLKRRDVVDCI